jgi:hypothetical protein
MTAKNEFPHHDTLPEDDFWGESTEASQQDWEEWNKPAGEQDQKTLEEVHDKPAGPIEPAPQIESANATPEQAMSPGFRARVKRMGSLLLRRTTHRQSSPELPTETLSEEESKGRPADKERKHDPWDLPTTDDELSPAQEKSVKPKRRDADEWGWATEEDDDTAESAKTKEPVYTIEHRAATVDTDNRSVVERFESQNFAKKAPSLHEQAKDITRTNHFSYVARDKRLDNFDPKRGETIVSMTEHEGLVELEAFLKQAAADGLVLQNRDLSAAAKTIAEDLTFIGEKEFTEAATGIKDLWKSYLEANPDNVLHIVAGVSEGSDKRKSDMYTVERILSTFSDEELAEYTGRIQLGLDDVRSTPDHTKIILVDDWTMSGSQQRDAADAIFTDPRFDDYRDGIEINLLACSQAKLERGLDRIYTTRGEFTVPIKAYYQAHDFSGLSSEFARGESPISGVHSSGDFGFEQLISDMVAVERAEGKDSVMPPLTNIVREYRYSESPISVDAEGRIAHGNIERKKMRQQREADIANEPLLQEIAVEDREAAKQRVIELYNASNEYVAPVIAGFAEHLLESAKGQQIILAGRDGIGTYIAAKKLQEKFPEPNEEMDQVLYAYLTRSIVFDTQPDILKKYLLQEGLRDVDAPVIIGDIGMYGSMMPRLRKALPQARAEYLISKAVTIPGYASNVVSGMDSMKQVSGNAAVHFMEDTFSGPITSPNGLVEQTDGSIAVSIPPHTFSAEEQLKRQYALQAIDDYVATLGKRPTTATSARDIRKLDVFLENADNYRELMVPHHSA